MEEQTRYRSERGTRIFDRLIKIGFTDRLSDEQFMKLRFFLLTGERLNLRNPQTFCEKVCWLMAHDHNPLYTKMADKYQAKQEVSRLIGPQYVIPLLGVYDRVEDIDLNELPEQFVLKCTHDSGSYVVCKDRATFDWQAGQRKLSNALAQSYFRIKREWAYKDIERRIIAEEYKEGLGEPDSVEYKLTCFNGRVGFVTVCKGVPHAGFADRYNDFFDRDLNPLPFHVYYENSPDPVELVPEIAQMIELSEVLSKGIPQVRVDWYLLDGQLYFGEMTFYTWSGICMFTPKEWDRTLGDLIDISLARG